MFMSNKHPNSLDGWRQMSIIKLRHAVFGYGTGVEDEKYFRDQLFALVIGRREPCDNFKEFLWQIAYERNDAGLTCKYLHFNEWRQRLSVDWAFQAWAEKVLAEIESKCKQFYADL